MLIDKNTFRLIGTKTKIFAEYYNETVHEDEWIIKNKRPNFEKVQGNALPDESYTGPWTFWNL